MEDLSKHQLILLTILITFVTSIATGIMTFTLLSEAPIEVTQTINRVVEKTIEQVAPVEVGKPEKIVTTVVVNEEDRVLDAISKNEKSIVRLKTRGADGSDVFVGLGIVISNSGIVVSDIRTYNPGFSYNIFFHDGKTYPSQNVVVDESRGLVFMNVSIPKTDDRAYTFYPATFGNSDGLKIGQTLVSISGRESNAVSIGRVRQLARLEDKTLKSIESDIVITRSTPGSPIVNLSGEMVGIEAPISEADSLYSYIPINPIKSKFSEALAGLSK